MRINIRVADFLSGLAPAELAQFPPALRLSIGIFNRAFRDCQKERYREDVISFARSEWAQALLMGSQTPEEIERVFRYAISQQEAKQQKRRI